MLVMSIRPNHMQPHFLGWERNEIILGSTIGVIRCNIEDRGYVRPTLPIIVKTSKEQQIMH